MQAVNKAAYMKRLDRLKAKTTPDTPLRNIQEDIELFTGLASDGLISDSTMEKIRANKNCPGFDAYECCTTDELRKLLEMCG